MNKRAKILMLDLLADVVGGILIAVGTYNFAAAAEFPMVGLNGIALIFYHLFGTPIGAVSLLLNIPVSIICFKTLGRKFFLNSLRSIVITSIIMDVFAPMFPVYKGDLLLAAICTGILSGAGYALIFLRDSSTGGTDFLTMSIKKKKPHLSIGNISFAIEAITIVIGTVTVSKQVDALIYGIIISYLMSMVMDKVMYGTSSGKLALIVTRKPNEIAQRIEEVSGRGCTFLEARGGYTDGDMDVVMCACNNKQMFPIRRAAKETDSESFIIILESNEVVGEGFKHA